MMKQEEDRKKKEKQLLLAREQAKQNFEKVSNQPGLKEIQDKQSDKKSGDDEEEQT